MEALRTLETLAREVENPEVVIIILAAMYFGVGFLRFAFRYIADSFSGFLKSIPAAIEKQITATEKTTETLEKIGETTDKTQRAVVTAFETTTEQFKASARQMITHQQALSTLLQNLIVAFQTMETNATNHHASLEANVTSTRTEMHELASEIKAQLDVIAGRVTEIAANSPYHEQGAIQRNEDMKVLLRQLIISTQELQIQFGNYQKLFIVPTDAGETTSDPTPEAAPESAETAAQAGIETPAS